MRYGSEGVEWGFVWQEATGRPASGITRASSTEWQARMMLSRMFGMSLDCPCVRKRIGGKSAEWMVWEERVRE